MFGPIIAAPLAMPVIWISRPPMRDACGRPACGPCRWSTCRGRRRPAHASLRPSFTAAAAMPCSILSIGRNSPITPVESTSAWSASAPQAAAARRAISSASRRPRSPVQALALPELIDHRADAIAGRAAAVERHRRGEDQVLRIDAGRLAGRSDMTSVRSCFCGSRLIRQWTPASRKPLGTRMAMRIDLSVVAVAKPQVGTIAESHVDSATVRLQFTAPWFPDSRTSG